MTTANALQRSDLLARHHSDNNSKIGFLSNSAVLFWTNMYTNKCIINLPPPLIEYGRPIVTIETGSQRAKPVPD